MKKAISLAVATAMTAGLLAGGGTAATRSSTAAADSTPQLPAPRLSLPSAMRSTPPIPSS